MQEAEVDFADARQPGAERRKASDQRTATMNMTLRYAHLSPEVARDAVRLPDKTPPRENWAANGQQAPRC